MAIDARKHNGRPEVNLEIVVGPMESRLPVQVTLDAHGISVRRKGRRRSRTLRIEWDTAISRMVPTSRQVPAKYLSNPLGLLVDG